jgi:uncharacterized protein (DUF697 family)
MLLFHPPQKPCPLQTANNKPSPFPVKLAMVNVLKQIYFGKLGAGLSVKLMAKQFHVVWVPRHGQSLVTILETVVVVHGLLMKRNVIHFLALIGKQVNGAPAMHLVARVSRREPLSA